MSDLNATLFGFTAKTDIEMAIRDVTKTPRTVYDYKIVLVDVIGYVATDSPRVDEMTDRCINIRYAIP